MEFLAHLQPEESHGCVGRRGLGSAVNLKDTSIANNQLVVEGILIVVRLCYSVRKRKVDGLHGHTASRASDLDHVIVKRDRGCLAVGRGPADILRIADVYPPAVMVTARVDCTEAKRRRKRCECFAPHYLVVVAVSYFVGQRC